jgi:hypothetical protein
MSAIHGLVRPQLDAIALDPNRPLIISDADEVLFLFMEAFERFLATRDLWIDLSSFALAGNIKRLGTNEPIGVEAARELLPGFFAEATETMEPVPGAADALAALSERAQVVIVSNVPVEQRDARIRALARHSMAYPVVANVGAKGGVVRHLADQVRGPVFFLDDIPHNHMSVATHAEDVRRIHFVADSRLARLIPASEHSHHRIDDWPTARALIEETLADAGF